MAALFRLLESLLTIPGYDEETSCLGRVFSFGSSFHPTCLDLVLGSVLSGLGIWRFLSAEGVELFSRSNLVSISRLEAVSSIDRRIKLATDTSFRMSSSIVELPYVNRSRAILVLRLYISRILEASVQPQDYLVKKTYRKVSYTLFGQ